MAGGRRLLVVTVVDFQNGWHDTPPIGHTLVDTHVSYTRLRPFGDLHGSTATPIKETLQKKQEVAERPQPFSVCLPAPPSNCWKLLLSFAVGLRLPLDVFSALQPFLLPPFFFFFCCLRSSLFIGS
ncbi:hypothetical protein RchiOBHm_Chr3g0486411 [Rosa chinensis]|uniref:Uncharacterized protein n=1 Tax=Rosa chinensis TaxID=74649 RepID=A0A2P6RF80_ROSCH|nr:hypothetical protein RchiOBHm_Chr3g0486411 [Rosa chinensis]